MKEWENVESFDQPKKKVSHKFYLTQERRVHNIYCFVVRVCVEHAAQPQDKTKVFESRHYVMQLPIACIFIHVLSVYSAHIQILHSMCPEKDKLSGKDLHPILLLVDVA